MPNARAVTGSDGRANSMEARGLTCSDKDRYNAKPVEYVLSKKKLPKMLGNIPKYQSVVTDRLRTVCDALGVDLAVKVMILEKGGYQITINESTYSIVPKGKYQYEEAGASWMNLRRIK